MSLFWSNIKKHLQLNNERRSTIIVVEVKGEACVGHHNKKGDARQDPSLWGKNITFGSAAYSIVSTVTIMIFHGQLWWGLSLDRWRRLSVDGLTGVGAVSEMLTHLKTSPVTLRPRSRSPFQQLGKVLARATVSFALPVSTTAALSALVAPSSFCAWTQYSFCQ